MYIRKASKMTFVQKTRVFNVDEIETYSLMILGDCRFKCQTHCAGRRYFHRGRTFSPDGYEFVPY
jgi:hypothetical protein